MRQEIKDLIAEAREAMTERDDTGWFWVGRLADALEAATRVPMQGEPGDELIEYALDYIENGTMRPERRKALRALAALAAVPDAATREPIGAGEYILALIETIKKTGGSVEIHGVKIMPCDEYGRTGVERDAALDGAPEPEEKP